MPITYDLTTDAGKVRLHLGDTVDGVGPRPDKRNFSDAEITYLLAAETTVTAAVALGFETLSGEWAAYSIQEREGDVSYDAKGLAEVYAELADDWRDKPDGGNGSGTLQAGVIALDFMAKGDD